MKTITKQIQKEPKRLAASLPATYYDTPVYRVVPGEILVRNGVEKVQDRPVKSHKNYLAKSSAQVQVNDYKRLLRIYKSQGIDAVKKYVADVKEVNAIRPGMIL